MRAVSSTEETTLAADAATGPGERGRPGAGDRLARGSVLGRYVVLDEIGAGAMGRVYAAYDPRLDRKVALKLVRLEHTDDDARRRGRDRLLREAQTLAKLAHPNVVAVYDVELVDDGVAVAMDFIDGKTLRTWLCDASPHWRQVLQVFVAAGRGLAAAHRAGVVHRDFKPDNVMVEHGAGAGAAIGEGRGDRVLVVDFGIARVLDSSASETMVASHDPDAVQDQSRTQGLAGTPAYMAPEQLAGHDVDARSDQFAFCVSLWEGLYGVRPFVADSLPTLVYRVTRGEIVEPPRDTTVPGWLREVVRKGLSVEPENRWCDMDALLLALQRDPWRRRRPWLVTGGVLGSLGVVAGGVVARIEPPPCRAGGEQLEKVWDDAVADEVKRAFEAIERPYAARAYEVIETRLHAYSSAWVRMYTDNCEATHVRGEQSEALMDLRMACLQRRRQALRASTERLREADEEVAHNAARIVANLPPLDLCADLEALTAPVPLPEDPEARLEIERIEARLADVDASIHAGKYTDALHAIETLEVDTVSLEHAPTRADVLLRLGYLQDKAGDAEAAEQTLQQAAWLAQRSRHDAVAARAMSELVYVVGGSTVRYGDAIVWAQHADAMVGRIGDRVELARLLHNRGLTHTTAGKPELAKRDLHDARELRASELGVDHPDTINSLASLATALDNLEEVQAAVVAYEQAVQEASRLLGPMHPRVAGYQSNLAELLGRMGEGERAAVHAQQAVSIMREAMAPDHPFLVSALINLGTVHFVLEDPVASEAAMLEAREIVRRAAAGKPDEREATILHNLGAISTRRGDDDAAIDYFKAALEVYEAILGPEHPELVDSLHNTALVLRDAGRFDDAVSLASRALAIQLGDGRSQELATGRLRTLLAELELEREHEDSALIHAREAVAVLEEHELSRHHLALAQLVLARASWSEPRSRRVVFEQVRSALGHVPPDRPDVRHQLEEWLAEHDRL